MEDKTKPSRLRQAIWDCENDLFHAQKNLAKAIGELFPKDTFVVVEKANDKWRGKVVWPAEAGSFGALGIEHAQNRRIYAIHHRHLSLDEETTEEGESGR